VLCEQLSNFFGISLDDFTSFSDESSFDVINLVMIVLTHVSELLSHGFNELINIIILLLDLLDVFFILALQLINKSLDEYILLFDDLVTGFLLDINILS